MDHEHMEHNNGRHVSRGKWFLIGFLAVAAFFLWTEHRAHVLGILPYLLVLACPLMHLFHHHGHGHRHGDTPPAVGFVLIMFGFLLQWPTIITLAMFPVLVVVYMRLAKAEEKDSLVQFGAEYAAYMQRTPAFIPKFSRERKPV